MDVSNNGQQFNNMPSNSTSDIIIKTNGFQRQGASTSNNMRYNSNTKQRLMDAFTHGNKP